MPELPELEVLKEGLVSRIRGKKIKRLQILKPYILKNYFTPLEKHRQPMGRQKKKSALVKPAGGILSNAHSAFLTGYTYDLSGEKIENINRRGKYLIIELDKHNIVVHLMLRGAMKYVLHGTKLKKSSAAVINFEDGSVLEMSETGHKKRMSIFILPKDKTLEKFDTLGIEPLQNNFTVEKLKILLHSENKQVKSFLCNQKKIVGIGNAYADEVLWHARLSPFKMSKRLNAQEVEELHSSIIHILHWAIKHVREKGVQEKRSFLQVHGKKGKPCPRCSEPIQFVSFTQSETFYCPTCQTQGRKLKNRRMSKFYR
jgi:formamidopyrimidine-DNA glycosylase